MLKQMSLAFASLALVAAPVAMAAPCKDAKGKFVKCPSAPVAKPVAKRCKDAKGKFAKCGTPGAK
jgi:hypothetical protein